jgi:hypothetical protein
LRKLRIVAHLIAEVSVPRGAGEPMPPARTLLARALFFVAWFGVCLWILLASAALLPPWPMLVIALVAILSFAGFRWRSMERVYAAAQLSLRETLTRPPETPPVERRVLPTILEEAKLEMVAITADSPASGKLIRELALRTRTGASAVAIERAGKTANVINPGPDEDVQAGDSLLLLGSPEQLTAAQAMLTAK